MLVMGKPLPQWLYCCFKCSVKRSEYAHRALVCISGIGSIWNTYKSIRQCYRIRSVLILALVASRSAIGIRSERNLCSWMYEMSIWMLLFAGD